MKKIDLLVQRYLDFLSAADALLFVDDGIVTSHFDAVSNRKHLHVSFDFLVELASEEGLKIEASPYPCGKVHDTEYSVCYEGITIYALGVRNGTP